MQSTKVATCGSECNWYQFSDKAKKVKVLLRVQKPSQVPWLAYYTRTPYFASGRALTSNEQPPGLYHLSKGDSTYRLTNCQLINVLSSQGNIDQGVPRSNKASAGPTAQPNRRDLVQRSVTTWYRTTTPFASKCARLHTILLYDFRSTNCNYC